MCNFLESQIINTPISHLHKEMLVLGGSHIEFYSNSSSFYAFGEANTSTNIHE